MLLENLKTDDEAKESICHLKLINPAVLDKKCLGKKCNAWRVKLSHFKRENHSGADVMLMNISEGRRILREGGPGGGYIYVEEYGYCGLIDIKTL